MTTLEFADINGMPLGRVSLVDGKLETTTPTVKTLVVQAEAKDVTGADFIKKYADYSNGYMSAKVVTDDL